MPVSIWLRALPTIETAFLDADIKKPAGDATSLRVEANLTVLWESALHIHKGPAIVSAFLAKVCVLEPHLSRFNSAPM